MRRVCYFPFHFLSYTFSSEDGITLEKNRGCTLLFIASRKGHLSVVQLLLNQSFSSCFLACFLQGCLYFAMFFCLLSSHLFFLLDFGCSHLFLKRLAFPAVCFPGADVHGSKHANGATALCIACQGGHVGVVRALIAKGRLADAHIVQLICKLFRLSGMSANDFKCLQFPPKQSSFYFNSC